MILRQRFELDLLEVAPNMSSDLSTGSPSVVLSLTGNTAPVTVNVGSIATANAIDVHTEISKTINGDITYNERDEELLKLFVEQCGRLEAVQLRSDLDQLKDTSTPPSARQTARQRIASFLLRSGAKAADKAAELGINALIVYLDGLLKGTA